MSDSIRNTQCYITPFNVYNIIDLQVAGYLSNCVAASLHHHASGLYTASANINTLYVHTSI